MFLSSNSAQKSSMSLVSGNRLIHSHPFTPLFDSTSYGVEPFSDSPWFTRERLRDLIFGDTRSISGSAVAIVASKGFLQIF